jgi:hypothetical protein
MPSLAHTMQSGIAATTEATAAPLLNADVHRVHCVSRFCRKVINLSLTGTPSEAVEAAIYQAYLAGLTLVTSAGNSNDDACFYSPARANGVLTVAATVRTDARA